MSRVQVEIFLGTVLVFLTSSFLLWYGFGEGQRMVRFEAAQEAQEIEVGAALFESNCSGCHGLKGEGVPGLCPPLNDRHFFTDRLKEVGWSGTLEDYIVAAVSSGRLQSTRPELYAGGGKPAMPAWSEQFGGPLRADQVRSLARFILNWEATALEQVDLVEIPTPTPVADDPISRGQAVYTQNACGACHTLGSLSAGMAAPNLTQIGTTAATRVEGLSAEEYLLQSILDPNTFVVPDCPSAPCAPNVMPQNFGETLSDEQLSDLVAFLLAQK
jgi:mono/diheme cytochrome c family protein